EADRYGSLVPLRRAKAPTPSPCATVVQAAGLGHGAFLGARATAVGAVAPLCCCLAGCLGYSSVAPCSIFFVNLVFYIEFLEESHPDMLSSSTLPTGVTELLEESPSKKLLDAIIQEDCDAS
ncbi:hypothetical protein L7F22_028904, partial [Adiantum nelumboides]|nr:hypothetical protein [Adiantum nelumboides]